MRSKRQRREALALGLILPVDVLGEGQRHAVRVGGLSHGLGTLVGERLSRENTLARALSGKLEGCPGWDADSCAHVCRSMATAGLSPSLQLPPEAAVPW